MNPLKRRVTVGLFGVALVAAACGGGSGTASGGNPHKSPAAASNSATSNGTATGQAAAKPTGTGTNDDPFVAACDDPKQVDCTVSSFAVLDINCCGATQTPPAYKCPGDHPYLLAHFFQPPGSTWVRGEDFNRGPGVNIYTSNTLEVGSPKGPRQAGQRNGPLDAGVTNWDVYSHTYQAILHCTSDPDHGYD